MAAWRKQTAPFRRRRAQERLYRRRMVRSVVMTLTLAAVLSSVWYGTRSDAVTIGSVAVSGTETLDPNDVRAAVNAALNGSYALLVPKRFSYLYPEEHVRTAVAALPRVDEVSVVRNSRTALEIAITEHEPYALWCSTITENESTDCFFVTTEGYAYRSAPPLRGTTFLRYMKEDAAPELGKSLASAEYMQATGEFVRALEQEQNMHVYGIIETADGDVRYAVRGGGELLVVRDADIQSVFENLASILASEEFAHIAPGNFSYIDLRFGNRVFVKETPEDTAIAAKSDGDEIDVVASTPADSTATMLSVPAQETVSGVVAEETPEE